MINFFKQSKTSKLQNFKTSKLQNFKTSKMLHSHHFSKCNHNKRYQIFEERESFLEKIDSLSSDDLKRVYDENDDNLKDAFYEYVYHNPEAELKVIDWCLTRFPAQRDFHFNVIGASFERIYNMVKKYNIKSREIDRVIYRRARNPRENHFKEELQSLGFIIESDRVLYGRENMKKIFNYVCF